MELIFLEPKVGWKEMALLGEMGRKSKVVLLPTVWVLDLACLGLLWKKLRPYSLEVWENS